MTDKEGSVIHTGGSAVLGIIPVDRWLCVPIFQLVYLCQRIKFSGIIHGKQILFHRFIDLAHLTKDFLLTGC